jgi:hypothetical protein
MGRARRFTDEQLRQAIASSRSWSETLRYLRYRSAGGNWKTLKRHAARLGIDTSHFDPHAASLEGLRRFNGPKPLEEILVENSNYKRHALKQRLFKAGLKKRECELCGQGDMWHGIKIALILDHINGIPDDNRLENLRILCPNCNATLDTHCGRKNRRPPLECKWCGLSFRPKHSKQRYCSRRCGQAVPGRKARRVARPPYEQLLREVQETSYVAVGRKYGVSDNAVRKWVRFYRREAELRKDGGQDAEAA